MACFRPSIVITTAPTFTQVEKQLWGEIRSALDRGNIDFGGQLLQTEWRIDNKHYALGISTKEKDRFAGFHSDHVLVIFDEGSGVSADIYEAKAALMASGFTRFLAIGNPLFPRGDFYDAFRIGGEGRLKISCYDAVNVGINGLVKQDWIDEQKKRFENGLNPLYEARVLGEFPTTSIDTILSLADIENAVNNPVTVVTGEKPPVIISCDPAFQGDDETVIQVWSGYTLVNQRTFNKREPMETAGEIVIDKLKYGASHIVIDSDGGGIGIASRLKELGHNTIEIHSASKGGVGFHNLRAKMWWNARELFKNKQVRIFPDQILREQLLMVTYSPHSSGNILIGKKSEIKSDFGVSPDRADCLTYALWAMKMLFDSGVTSVNKELGKEFWMYKTEKQKQEVLIPYLD